MQPPPSPVELNLENCDREPIHIPGSIQPHGALAAESPAPSPLADIHIDLPADDESEDDATLVELPVDDGEDDGGDTQRMPL